MTGFLGNGRKLDASVKLRTIEKWNPAYGRKGHFIHNFNAMDTLPFKRQGLAEVEVLRSRAEHGPNKATYHREGTLLQSVKAVVMEPMFILLLVAAAIYLVLGEIPEAAFMTAAILLVSAISFYQDNRSRKALMALQELTAPKAQVLREGVIRELAASEIVMGDLVVASEGQLVPADGRVLSAADFSVNESMLTGEAFSVFKGADDREPFVWQGTQVVSGQALVEVTAIGNDTRLGRISGSLLAIGEEKTPLQRQVEAFVKRMAAIGLAVFLAVWLMQFLRSGSVLQSLLKGLTLAMSILPEEIPVAFSTFMALGAWRMMKRGVIVKNMRTVETLGTADVVCTDKTGTITENRMVLESVAVGAACERFDGTEMEHDASAARLIRTAMFASETAPFDPMEKAIHEAYVRLHTADERSRYRMVHEYPLEGRPPMMTHVFESVDGERVVAAKGAPEAVLSCCRLPKEDLERILSAADSMARDGYRILAVAESEHTGNAYPQSQRELELDFKGLLAFHDPPKPGIREVFETFGKAGIEVKVLTGDNPATTRAIAAQAGLRHADRTVHADDLEGKDGAELDGIVAEAAVFTRMHPEAKLRVIESLKRQGHIVAMTGDGVNDAPALKASHIGIAMGRRGSSLARSASTLILTDDDFGRMTEAVAMGRRIYSNLKKAIRYIVSIHIPIILTVLLPLLLGWQYPDIFTPVHVIFLELIMGPTCSIVYENEPEEPQLMLQPPRRMTESFLTWRELSISLWQGLAITAGTLITYRIAVAGGSGEEATRTVVFVCLVAANIALTLVNRSFTRSFLHTMAYRNRLLTGIVAFTAALTAMLVSVPAFRGFFRFAVPDAGLLSTAVGIGVASVLWFELLKWRRRVTDATSGD